MGYEFIFYTGNELLDCCFEEDTSYEIFSQTFIFALIFHALSDQQVARK